MIALRNSTVSRAQVKMSELLPLRLKISKPLRTRFKRSLELRPIFKTNLTLFFTGWIMPPMPKSRGLWKVFIVSLQKPALIRTKWFISGKPAARAKVKQLLILAGLNIRHSYWAILTTAQRCNATLTRNSTVILTYCALKYSKSCPVMSTSSTCANVIGFKNMMKSKVIINC